MLTPFPHEAVVGEVGGNGLVVGTAAIGCMYVGGDGFRMVLTGLTVG